VGSAPGGNAYSFIKKREKGAEHPISANRLGPGKGPPSNAPLFSGKEGSDSFATLQGEKKEGTEPKSSHRLQATNVKEGTAIVSSTKEKEGKRKKGVHTSPLLHRGEEEENTEESPAYEARHGQET